MHIILWESGMVMAFDAAGKQMPELQGHASEVLEKVMAATEDVRVRATFELGKWRQGTTPCSREEFKLSAERAPALEGGK